MLGCADKYVDLGSAWLNWVLLLDELALPVAEDDFVEDLFDNFLRNDAMPVV